jgi:SAM-dependent methyltransferase
MTERPRSGKDYYEAAYSEHREQEWDEAPGKDVIIRALQALRDSGRLGDGERVLDLGCGTGYLLQRAHDDVCATWSLHGVDLAERAVELGRARFPSLDLVAEDATQTQFERAAFSIALSYGSLEHFPAPEEGIRELARLLEEGGLFLVMVPTLGVYREDRADEGWYPDFTGQPQWNWTRSTWERHFAEYSLDLWETESAVAYGAQKPGVFYFGNKGSEGLKTSL